MSRPNLVLLTVECWRNDHFGVWTPNLANLGEAVVFDSAYASGGWTLPSMTGLMSSAYASMFGGCRVAMASPERPVLAECLMRSGYWTAGFSANPVCGGVNGFHRGFGKFRDERRKPSPEHGTFQDALPNWTRMVELGVSPRDLDNDCDAAHMTDRGLKWLETRNSSSPFFLWLHYMDPHWPCLTPDPPANRQQLHDAWYDRRLFRSQVIPRRGQFDPGEEVGQRWIGRYRQALTSADREIGKLLDSLRLREDWDRTIVAVMGDHGEEFYEHGTWHHAWNKLYEEGIRVPLILRVPGGKPAVIRQSVSNLDVAPTLLDYADALQQPEAGLMIGRSLRALIEGRRPPARAVYSEMLHHPESAAYLLAIVEDGWKYIYDLKDPQNSKLFHMIGDPAERHNVREEHPEIFRRFEKMRLAHVSRGLTKIMKRRSLGEKDAEMDDAVKEQMIALGYLSEDSPRASAQDSPACSVAARAGSAAPFTDGNPGIGAGSRWYKS